MQPKDTIFSNGPCEISFAPLANLTESNPLGEVISDSLSILEADDADDAPTASIQSPKGLAKTYEGICEEYRKRLCDQWQLDIRDSWWIPSDRIGMTLALNDLEYSLGMEDVRLMVDLNVNYEDFNEWWNHCLGDTKYHINAFNWFVNGARPGYLVNG